MVSNYHENDQLGEHLGRFTYLPFKTVSAIDAVTSRVSNRNLE